MNATEYATLCVDNVGLVQGWSAGAKRLYGYDDSEILGRQVAVLLDCNLQGTQDIWSVRKDGTKLWSNVTVICTAFGRILVIRNMSDHKEVERRIANIHKESAVMKSELLANLSHEIRTPLSGVVAAGALLMDTTLISEQEELLEIIMHSGEVLLRVINDILDYSRLDGVKLRDEEFDLHRALRKLFASYSIRQDKVSMTMRIDPSVPRSVRGDCMRICQIIGNVLSNACKFTHEGTIKLEINTKPGESRECILLTAVVTDTGPGLSEQALQKLFTPFQQGDQSSSKSHQGTGLGLSICKRLLQAMRGDIKVKNTCGECSTGTTVTLEIPLKMAGACSPGPPSAVSPHKSMTPTADNPTARLLLAEDNLINQKIAVKMLHRIGYSNVTVVHNGLEAVQAHQTEPFDLVLMDCMMPVMDGYMATRKLRERCPDLPIVAMTANAVQGDEQVCLDSGMSDYLAKPVSIAKLANTLNHWL